jgi:hypothetical protein
VGAPGGRWGLLHLAYRRNDRAEVDVDGDRRKPPRTNTEVMPVCTTDVRARGGVGSFSLGAGFYRRMGFSLKEVPTSERSVLILRGAEETPLDIAEFGL